MATDDVAVEIKQVPPAPYDNENATETNDGDGANATEAEQQSDDESVAWKCLKYFGLTVFYIIFGILFFVAVVVYVIVALAAWLFANIDITEYKPESPIKVDDKKVFQKVAEVQKKANKLRKLPHVIQSRLAIFVFAWVIVNFTVPVLRNKTILGTKLWKWTLFVTTISCGYYLINILSKSVVSALCATPRFKKKQSWAYYAQGLRESLNLVALAALILLSWVSYFRTGHGIEKNKDTRTFLHVCTWSFVTFAVTAVLWLLKSVLLLKWKADAVYRRFTHRILVARDQVYILGYICGWSLGVFKPTSEEDKEQIILEGDPDPTTEASGPEEQESNDTPITAPLEGVGEQPETSKVVEKTKSTKKKEAKEEENKENIKDGKEKATEILRSGKKDVNLYQIQMMTEYFVDLFKVSSRDDDSTSEIVKQCKKINEDTDPDGLVDEKDLVKIFELEEKDAKNLLEKMRITLHSKTISHRGFEKSMVRAHNNCVALGHTLSDAEEVVEVLNNVMIILLLGIVFIAWLLLTDIATTKILVLIASPLLAVTFIFGDTCKKIFEGIIFSFINHPFDVGDRCIIGTNEVEVRRMSVLTTTFIGIGTKEEVLYPNSALAAVAITNLKGEPDSSDFVELTLDSTYTKSRIGVIDDNIKEFFKNDISGKFEGKCSVVVKEIGSGVKMEVQFEHVMSISELTHSQCLKKKQENKSYLYLHIKECMDESEQEYKKLMDKENQSPLAGTGTSN